LRPLLYLDEDITQELARLMRELGFDVLSARDLGHVGITDDEQLDIASALERAIVSANCRDFARIARERAAAKSEHWGIVLIQYQVRRDTLGAAVAELSRFADAHDREYVRTVTMFSECRR
jgi:uncharacterized protein with PIN domain